MRVTGSSTEQNDIEVSMREAKTRLDRLERHEWWRWTLAFVVMLALTIGMFALSLPLANSGMEGLQLSITLRALLALVLLFDVFVVHQQFLIKKLRRDLAAQLGVISAFESIQGREDETIGPRVERRRVRRSGLDRRLRVKSLNERNPAPAYGRIRDICEDGLGAIIPCTLHIGEKVSLEFSVDDKDDTIVQAVVRHRKSFHYGFEFTRIDSSLQSAISRFVQEHEGAYAGR